MAEIVTIDPTGNTLYFFVLNSSGEYWSTVATDFVAYNVANIADYDVVMADANAVGIYTGTFPSHANVVAGIYEVVIKRRPGAVAAADVAVGGATYSWNGTTLRENSDVQSIKGQTVTCAAGVTIRADVGAAAAPGASNGMLIGGSNAATTFATLTVSGATSLQSLGITTLTASGAMSAASLTLSGTLQAATIVSTGTTTLNALTITNAATLGTLTVSGTTTLAAIAQTGAVSLGAITIASMAVTGALTTGSADFTTVLPVNTIQINGSALAAQVLAAKNYEYQDDAVVLVADGATDTARGTNLGTAYAAASALTPGGNALSASNRAAVLIPKAHYRRTATLDFDTDFVDPIALEPEMGGRRMPTDVDEVDGTTSLVSFRPPKTLVYSDTNGVTAIEQSCQDIRPVGFGVAQLSGYATGSYHGWYVSGDDNEGSIYDQMYFWHKAPNTDFSTVVRYPIAFAKHVKGIWKNCISNSLGWRVGYDAQDEGQFSATMYDCEGGTYCFIGDYPSGHKGTHKATNTLLERCKAIGVLISTASGYASFAGCSQFALDVDSSCCFIDCESGDNSGGLGAKNEGTWIRYRGGINNLGSTTSITYPGEFAGYAEDCICGAGSFGGRKVNIGDFGSLTGTLKHCICEDSALPWRVEGATIDDCLLTVGTNDQDCITLLDSLSRINNSTILVVEGGTGIPINAASALNVSAIRNNYNNESVAADGLGDNVTNVGTGDVPTDWVDAGRLDAILDAVVADTNELQTDWTNDGRLDLILDAVVADTNELQTDWTDGGRLDLILDDVPTTAEFEARTITAADYFVDSDYTAPDNASIAAILNDTGTSGVLLSDSEDVYHADIFLTRDTTNSRDEYTIQWYKNGNAVTSKVTGPTIQVIKRVDGTDLIASTAITSLGSSGTFKYDSTVRLSAGEAAIAVVTATIDGALRSWPRPVGRDV